MLENKNISSFLIGILMTLMGVYVWFHPLDILVVAAMYLGIVFIIAGVVYIINFLRNTRNHRYLVYGILNAILGFVLVGNSSIIAISLLVILALWILFSSILQISAAIDLKYITNSFWIYPLISAIFGIIFSLIILFHPKAGMLTIAIIIGTYMVMYGLVNIAEYFIINEYDEEE